MRFEAGLGASRLARAGERELERSGYRTDVSQSSANEAKFVRQCGGFMWQESQTSAVEGFCVCVCSCRGDTLARTELLSY